MLIEEVRNDARGKRTATWQTAIGLASYPTLVRTYWQGWAALGPLRATRYWDHMGAGSHSTYS